MHQTLSLISISLPKPLVRHEVEKKLDCSLKKGIEKAFYSEYRESYIVYTQFNVITFINYPREEIVKSLQKLDIKNADSFEQNMIYQDYPIIIDSTLELTCKVNNDTIVLKESSTLSFIIIALVVSQSVGLEK
ncbi:MAG: RMD1 family protein, partial [Campylobacteraceae bacterium]|nr:RMD1 family protein [Campylobacteraceae bacterium]